MNVMLYVQICNYECMIRMKIVYVISIFPCAANVVRWIVVN